MKKLRASLILALAVALSLLLLYFIGLSSSVSLKNTQPNQPIHILSDLSDSSSNVAYALAAVTAVDVDFLHSSPLLVTIAEVESDPNLNEGLISSVDLSFTSFPSWERNWRSQVSADYVAYQQRISLVSTDADTDADSAETVNRAVIALSLDITPIVAAASEISLEDIMLYYWSTDGSSEVIGITGAELYARAGILPWLATDEVGLELHLPATFSDSSNASVDRALNDLLGLEFSRLYVYQPVGADGLGDDRPMFFVGGIGEPQACKAHLISQTGASSRLYMDAGCVGAGSAEYVGGYYHYYYNNGDSSINVQHYYEREEMQVSENDLAWFGADELLGILESSGEGLIGLVTQRSEIEVFAGSSILLPAVETAGGERLSLVSIDGEGGSLYVRSSLSDISGELAINEQDNKASGIVVSREEETSASGAGLSTYDYLHKGLRETDADAAADQAEQSNGVIETEVSSDSGSSGSSDVFLLQAQEQEQEQRQSQAEITEALAADAITEALAVDVDIVLPAIAFDADNPIGTNGYSHLVRWSITTTDEQRMHIKKASYKVYNRGETDALVSGKVDIPEAVGEGEVVTPFTAYFLDKRIEDFDIEVRVQYLADDDSVINPTAAGASNEVTATVERPFAVRGGYPIGYVDIATLPDELVRADSVMLNLRFRNLDPGNNNIANDIFTDNLSYKLYELTGETGPFGLGDEITDVNVAGVLGDYQDNSAGDSFFDEFFINDIVLETGKNYAILLELAGKNTEDDTNTEAQLLLGVRISLAATFAPGKAIDTDYVVSPFIDGNDDTGNLAVDPSFVPDLSRTYTVSADGRFAIPVIDDYEITNYASIYATNNNVIFGMGDGSATRPKMLFERFENGGAQAIIYDVVDGAPGTSQLVPLSIAASGLWLMSPPGLGADSDSDSAVDPAPLMPQTMIINSYIRSTVAGDTGFNNAMSIYYKPVNGRGVVVSVGEVGGEYIVAANRAITCSELENLNPEVADYCDKHGIYDFINWNIFYDYADGSDSDMRVIASPASDTDNSRLAVPFIHVDNRINRYQAYTYDDNGNEVIAQIYTDESDTGNPDNVFDTSDLNLVNLMNADQISLSLRIPKIAVGTAGSDIPGFGLRALVVDTVTTITVHEMRHNIRQRIVPEEITKVAGYPGIAWQVAPALRFGESGSYTVAVGGVQTKTEGSGTIGVGQTSIEHIFDGLLGGEYDVDITMNYTNTFGQELAPVIYSFNDISVDGFEFPDRSDFRSNLIIPVPVPATGPIPRPAAFYINTPPSDSGEVSQYIVAPPSIDSDIPYNNNARMLTPGYITPHDATTPAERELRSRGTFTARNAHYDASCPCHILRILDLGEILQPPLWMMQVVSVGSSQITNLVGAWMLTAANTENNGGVDSNVLGNVADVDPLIVEATPNMKLLEMKFTPNTFSDSKIRLDLMWDNPDSEYIEELHFYNQKGVRKTILARFDADGNAVTRATIDFDFYDFYDSDERFVGITTLRVLGLYRSFANPVVDMSVRMAKSNNELNLNLDLNLAPQNLKLLRQSQANGLINVSWSPAAIPALGYRVLQIDSDDSILQTLSDVSASVRLAGPYDVGTGADVRLAVAAVYPEGIVVRSTLLEFNLPQVAVDFPAVALAANPIETNGVFHLVKWNVDSTAQQRTAYPSLSYEIIDKAGVNGLATVATGDVILTEDSQAIRPYFGEYRVDDYDLEIRTSFQDEDGTSYDPVTTMINVPLAQRDYKLTVPYLTDLAVAATDTDDNSYTMLLKIAGGDFTSRQFNVSALASGGNYAYTNIPSSYDMSAGETTFTLANVNSDNEHSHLQSGMLDFIFSDAGAGAVAGGAGVAVVHGWRTQSLGPNFADSQVYKHIPFFGTELIALDDMNEESYPANKTPQYPDITVSSDGRVMVPLRGGLANDNQDALRTNIILSGKSVPRQSLLDDGTDIYRVFAHYTGVDNIVTTDWVNTLTVDDTGNWLTTPAGFLPDTETTAVVNVFVPNATGARVNNSPAIETTIAMGSVFARAAGAAGEARYTVDSTAACAIEDYRRDICYGNFDFGDAGGDTVTLRNALGWRFLNNLSFAQAPNPVVGEFDPADSGKVVIDYNIPDFGVYDDSSELRYTVSSRYMNSAFTAKRYLLNPNFNSAGLLGGEYDMNLDQYILTIGVPSTPVTEEGVDEVFIELFDEEEKIDSTIMTHAIMHINKYPVFESSAVEMNAAGVVQAIWNLAPTLTIEESGTYQVERSGVTMSGTIRAANDRPTTPIEGETAGFTVNLGEAVNLEGEQTVGITAAYTTSHGSTLSISTLITASFGYVDVPNKVVGTPAGEHVIEINVAVRAGASYMLSLVGVANATAALASGDTVPFDFSMDCDGGMCTSDREYELWLIESYAVGSETLKNRIGVWAVKLADDGKIDGEPVKRSSSLAPALASTDGSVAVAVSEDRNRDEFIVTVYLNNVVDSISAVQLYRQDLFIASADNRNPRFYITLTEGESLAGLEIFGSDANDVRFASSALDVALQFKQPQPPTVSQIMGDAMEKINVAFAPIGEPPGGLTGYRVLLLQSDGTKIDLNEGALLTPSEVGSGTYDIDNVDVAIGAVIVSVEAVYDHALLANPFTIASESTSFVVEHVDTTAVPITVRMPRSDATYTVSLVGEGGIVELATGANVVEFDFSGACSSGPCGEGTYELWLIEAVDAVDAVKNRIEEWTVALDGDGNVDGDSIAVDLMPAAALVPSNSVAISVTELINPAFVVNVSLSLADPLISAVHVYNQAGVSITSASTSLSEALITSSFSTTLSVGEDSLEVSMIVGSDPNAVRFASSDLDFSLQFMRPAEAVISQMSYAQAGGMINVEFTPIDPPPGGLTGYRVVLSRSGAEDMTLSGENLLAHDADTATYEVDNVAIGSVTVSVVAVYDHTLFADNNTVTVASAHVIEVKSTPPSQGGSAGAGGGGGGCALLGVDESFFSIFEWIFVTVSFVYLLGVSHSSHSSHRRRLKSFGLRLFCLVGVGCTKKVKDKRPI